MSFIDELDTGGGGGRGTNTPPKPNTASKGGSFMSEVDTGGPSGGFMSQVDTGGGGGGGFMDEVDTGGGPTNFMDEVDTGGGNGFMDEVDTGGVQGQTQTGGNKFGGAISQSAIDVATSLYGGSGDLSDTPISRTILRFSETSSSVKNFLSSPILSPLMEFGGILFPNTPRIGVAYTSSYSQIELSHTNYDYNSYNKSTIQSVSVGAKLTAQTLPEADYMLAVIHFLRTYSKMNYGVNDEERGQPPAIMKISAYGDYMINNFPVAIRHFALTLPDNVDYVQTSHNTQVPVYLEFDLDLIPMLTPLKVKNEFSLQGFASGDLITKGYL